MPTPIITIEDHENRTTIRADGVMIAEAHSYSGLSLKSDPRRPDREQRLRNAERFARTWNAHDLLVQAITEADGCFEAALAEGWVEAISDGNIEVIRDIWLRRLCSSRDAFPAALLAVNHGELPPVPAPAFPSPNEIIARALCAEIEGLLSHCTTKQRQIFARVFPEGIAKLSIERLKNAIAICQRTVRANLSAAETSKIGAP